MNKHQIHLKNLESALRFALNEIKHLFQVPTHLWTREKEKTLKNYAHLAQSLATQLYALTLSFPREEDNSAETLRRELL